MAQGSKHTQIVLNNPVGVDPTSLPNKNIWVSFPIKSRGIPGSWLDSGFGDCLIVNRDPNGRQIPDSMCLVRKANSPRRVSREKATETRNCIKYLLSQYGSRECSLHARFTEKAISFLRSTPDLGHTINKDHSVSQKEMAGRLFVQSVSDSGLMTIGVHSETSSGSEEGIEIPPSRFNFHSHPREAYHRHSVKHAWPSMTDYLGVLTLGKNTIFHCVSTLEGLYVISIGKDWVDIKKSSLKSFIKANYEISLKKNISPLEYIDLVSKITVLGAHTTSPIFDVIYLEWNKATSIFRAHFAKTGLTCKIHD